MREEGVCRERNCKEGEVLKEEGVCKEEEEGRGEEEEKRERERKEKGFKRGIYYNEEGVEKMEELWERSPCVALYGKRSAAMLVAVMGILKTGLECFFFFLFFFVFFFVCFFFFVFFFFFFFVFFCLFCFCFVFVFFLFFLFVLFFVFCFFVCVLFFMFFLMKEKDKLFLLSYLFIYSTPLFPPNFHF